MADTITLGDLATELVYEAGIDGKTGANARHADARIHALINRKYKQLRSLVTQYGEDFFRTPGATAVIPERTAGEDFIQLPWPDLAAEIIAIDVQLSGTWHELTHSSWPQRRIFPGPNRYDSPGEWTTVNMPQPSGITVTQGSIAIWPVTLGGNYKIDFVPHWTPITDVTHVFVLFPHWEEWLLAACAMAINQRDSNKRQAFDQARERMAIAEGQIVMHARRSKRGTPVQRRRDGLEL